MPVNNVLGSSFFRLLCCGFLILLVSCSGGVDISHGKEFEDWVDSKGKIRVLSTIGMIDDLVRRVGGEHVTSISLIKGNLDPHSYELVKGDGEKLEYADIIFYNGLGLEHGPSLKHSLENNPLAFSLGDIVREKYKELILEVDGQLDPHIWMDISMWMRTLPIIVEKLSKHDPEHAAAYRLNGQEFMLEMKRVDKEVRELLHSVPEDKRYLVTSHDAFNYFTRSYLAGPEEKDFEQWKIRFQSPEGLAPDAQISTMDIQNTLEHLEKYNISILFSESNVSKDSIRKILDAALEKDISVKIARTALYGDAKGESGSTGDSYLKMIRHNALTISNYLNGNYDEPTAK
ncbi:MAG: manganese/zinc/iron transport system substrate-binding protein [Chlamydiales bacterium]|jgi:manganese/zinc/iron transport system substrate-binding protein